MTAAPTASPETATDVRQVETAFGTFAVDGHSVIEFAEGLPGFEQTRRFVLLSSPELEPLHLLHNVEGPAASFKTISYRCSSRRRMRHMRCCP